MRKTRFKLQSVLGFENLPFPPRRVNRNSRSPCGAARLLEAAVSMFGKRGVLQEFLI
jgi:hypothetical protein